MKLKLNHDFLKHKKGDVVNVEEKDGVPIDKFWRKRLAESEMDNCVEVVTNNLEPVKQEKKEEKKAEVVVQKKNQKDEVNNDNS